MREKCMYFYIDNLLNSCCDDNVVVVTEKIAFSTLIS